MTYLPPSSTLDIGRLSRLFDNMSESYKLFWFNAIVDEVSKGNQRLTYDNLINDMIAEAWYMVSEYKLNLGPSDGLEFLIRYIQDAPDFSLKSSEKKSDIIDFLQTDATTDKTIQTQKRNLTLNVPYRFQAPFLDNLKGAKAWSGSQQTVADKINQHQRIIYFFTRIKGLDSEIEITPEWFDYITKNQAILKGWIRYNMIEYLQRRNPNVPGIINKLEPPQARNLTKVQNYWKTVLVVEDVREIYGNNLMTPKDLSIDHFVPWSYVTHDEFWNLSPTTKSVNSSKSNNLPVWEHYFPKFSDLHYQAYEATWKYDKIHEVFEKCRKEHINSDDAYMKLYRQGLSKTDFNGNLCEILYPVYQSAHTMGFKEWKYEE